MIRSILSTGLLLVCGCGLLTPGIRGSGKLATESRPVADFTGLSVSGSAEIEVTSGAPAPTCQITWDDNLLPYVSTEVVNGELRVELNGHRLTSTQGLQVKIAVPSLAECHFSGYSHAVITGIEQSVFKAELSGHHELKCSGQADEVHIDCGGSGKVLATDLVAKQVAVTIAGSGAVDVQASEKLSVNIMGSGTVRYAGQPLVTQNISGSGKIEQFQAASAQ